SAGSSDSSLLDGTRPEAVADSESAPKLVERLGTGDDARQRAHASMSRQYKWNIVVFVSLAGSFSPLSSNIYFPAIDSISRDLGVSTSLIALTVTVYMVVQGVAPSLLAVFSDTYGRRIAFAATLLIYTAANLALAFVPDFATLMVLRGLQAAGSAATISISSGVISDIATPEERGGFMGTNAGLRMSGQAIGPIIGGLLNNQWGFKSIFWLLFVMSTIVLLALVFFLPETHEGIVGDGNRPLTGISKPFIYYILKDPSQPSPQQPDEKRSMDGEKPGRPRLTLLSVFTPMAIIAQKDVFVLLAWGSLAYTAWSMVTSSTTTSLLHGHPYLKQWELGLCFLPNGMGCVAGSLVTGWLLDRSFRSAEAKYRLRNGLDADVEVSGRADFPFVRARMRTMPYFSAALITTTALYGPSYEFNDLDEGYRGNLAAPLGLQFFIAFSATAIFNMNSTMLIDSFRKSPTSATALNNLCRCLLGAGGVSVIQPLIDAVEIRNAFLIVTAILVIFSPLVWVEWVWGDEWRRAREERLSAEAGQ
ncbi:Sugar (and other) transporter, partial [Geosmithia morbida]